MRIVATLGDFFTPEQLAAVKNQIQAEQKGAPKQRRRRDEIVARNRAAVVQNARKKAEARFRRVSIEAALLYFEGGMGMERTTGEIFHAGKGERVNKCKLKPKDRGTCRSVSRTRSKGWRIEKCAERYGALVQSAHKRQDAIDAQYRERVIAREHGWR